MYAHLYFDSGTAPGEQIRDIVRLITSCTSSTASLSGLEFINTSTSTVVGGNSGWSLHSSSPTIPTTGTAVSSSDAYFILEASCTTVSKTKYCSIQANCLFTDHMVSDAQGTGVGTAGVGFNLANVLDPGTATEMFSAGYTGTANSRSDINSIVGTVDYSDNGVRIFADSTRILIHGKDGNGTTVLLGNAEFAETSTTTHQSLVPQCNFLIADMQGFNGSDTCSYRGETTAIWETEQLSSAFFQLSAATYSYNPNYLGIIRATGWHLRTTDIKDFGGRYRGSATRGNSTTNGNTSLGTTLGYGLQQNAGSMGAASALSLFGYTQIDPDIDDNNAYDNLWGRSNALAYDSSGNVGLALRKVFWEVEPNWNNDVLDITAVSNFWRVASGLGSDGDTITIGSDVYVYLNMVPGTNATLGAFLIKRT